MDLKGRNLFLYWIGHEYKLIKILRNLMYLHSKNGIGYTIHLITDQNITSYIPNIPHYFNSLLPAHQADFVRVNVICDYGGIWIDSDIIVMDSLDTLFNLIYDNTDTIDGFFIRENNRELFNGIFGSKSNTNLMTTWKSNINTILTEKGKNIQWSEIGSILLDTFYTNDPQLYSNYKIFMGLDTIYPCNWDKCVSEFCEKPYNNYNNLIREYQPVIILVNSVYKKVEACTVENILNGDMPLSYFLNKSVESMKHLQPFEFIEIGTSNFDTLLENATDDIIGLSVEPIKYYLDCLPDKQGVIKSNYAISNYSGTLDIYYIPETVIDDNKLDNWWKGCNSVNNYHPLHIKHNLTHLCNKDTVNVITPITLFFNYKIKNVNYLKVDTEGHDCTILQSLFEYLQYMSKTFYPKKIQFESNEHTKTTDIDNIINIYNQLGYKLISRGYDTILHI
jgi:hypothetical protein